MKGSIGTATYLSYIRPYWGKSITRLNYIDKLSPKAKVRYKAINRYSSGDYSLKQIGEIFEINRSTFYRWRKRYKPSRIQSLEDRSRRPHQVRTKVIRNHQVEMQVCQIRRKYSYFGMQISTEKYTIFHSKSAPLSVKKLINLCHLFPPSPVRPAIL